VPQEGAEEYSSSKLKPGLELARKLLVDRWRNDSECASQRDERNWAVYTV
jgi:hypothetical protein